MEDIRPRCCNTQYDQWTSTAQHHCHVVKEWSREWNDHDEAQTTAGAASYLQTGMHCCSCCGIFFDDNNLCTSLPNITGRGYIHLSGDPTRLPLPYAEHTAKAVVVVGYRVGGFRSGRWCIETCINAHLCSHARPSSTLVSSVGSGLS